MKSRSLIIALGILVLTTLSCQLISGLPAQLTPTPDWTSTPSPTFTPLPPIAVQAGEAHPDEPVFITGDIPYTSPFFLNTISEPFVLLEDEAGFARRDREFRFSLNEQVLGPVEVHEDNTLTYSLALPAIPQGTQLDVDNNGRSDSGVQVFALAYWSNTWGGPFLEDRDGKGWSNAYVSTITDPNNEDEIKGGTLIVWSPDDHQSFPTGFGADGKLFTGDDPTAPIPAGYNIIDLDQKPFKVSKEARPEIDLNEGEAAVNDYSNLDYQQAFESLFEKASREYPFTKEKGIDWAALKEKYTARVAQARNADDFYKAIRDFTLEIPDTHIGLSLNAEVFYQERGGGFGLVLAELSDGRVIVTEVLPGTAGERAGIQPGAELVNWDNLPVGEAIAKVVPYINHPYSTAHARRLVQIMLLTRVPSGTRVKISYKNPGVSQPKEVTLQAEDEYDSLFRSIDPFQQDELALPIAAEILDDSKLGYIRISTFSDDYNLMAQLWDRFMKQINENNVPGLIIDVRSNSGGSGGMATDFAGYFFDQEIVLYHEGYFNENTGVFDFPGEPTKIEPAPLQYAGPVALLVSPDCISACEGFAYAMQQQGRSIIVGHFPTAGAFGEVGRGQYDLPEGLSLQFPTGRPETLDGKLVIEGVGVKPDITVPVTEDSAMGKVDTVLQAAIEALQKKIQ